MFPNLIELFYLAVQSHWVLYIQSNIRMITLHDILFLVLSLVNSLPQSQVKKENSPAYPDLLNMACYSIQSVIICAQANENVVFLQMRGSLRSSGHWKRLHLQIKSCRLQSDHSVSQ